jgi:hypothetical protein
MLKKNIILKCILRCCGLLALSFVISILFFSELEAFPFLKDYSDCKRFTPDYVNQLLTSSEPPDVATLIEKADCWKYLFRQDYKQIFLNSLRGILYVESENIKSTYDLMIRKTKYRENVLTLAKYIDAKNDYYFVGENMRPLFTALQAFFLIQGMNDIANKLIFIEEEVYTDKRNQFNLPTIYASQFNLVEKGGRVFIVGATDSIQNPSDSQAVFDITSRLWELASSTYTYDKGKGANAMSTIDAMHSFVPLAVYRTTRRITSPSSQTYDNRPRSLKQYFEMLEVEDPAKYAPFITVEIKENISINYWEKNLPKWTEINEDRKKFLYFYTKLITTFKDSYCLLKYSTPVGE